MILMERKTFLIKIVHDNSEKTVDNLKNFLPGIIEKTEDISNFSIWKAEDMIFGYYETTREATASDTIIRSCLVEALGADAIILASPGNMRLMYNAIGLPREDKSALRQRVFITRLKPGCAEEYKRRHDAITPKAEEPARNRPTNNFTIWNAGDYICGYSEIDAFYVPPDTEHAKKRTVAWETKMLEIMDWLTNDVDYISGEQHVKIRCLYSSFTYSA